MTAQKKTKLYSGSRKTAKATAAFFPGNGKVRVNNVPVEIITPWVARDRIMTPLQIAVDFRDKVDIDVRVHGGGVIGQAEATAIAVSKGLVEYFKSKDLRKKIAEFDKHLLSGDPRQTEPKKFGGPGSRRRKQKSYR